MAYTYDNVGNRFQRGSSLAALPSTGLLNYDANDRTSADPYDANGNLLNSGVGRNVYDFENRLVQAGAVKLVYDGDGNRVKETVATTTTSFLVADQNLTGYAQVVDELQAGAVSRTYSYGLSLISQRQSISGTPATSFYGYDGHGSVRFLTSSTGAVTDTYDYDAFGNLISSTGTTPNNYLFAGEQFDPALGINYNRARYYDQRQGRFWTVDTYEGDPESPASLHKYLYASANPIDRVDPSGHAEIADVVAALSVASTLYGVASLAYHVYDAVTATSKDEHDAAVFAAYQDAAGVTFALLGLGGGSLGPRLAAAGYSQIAILAGRGLSIAERAGSVAASLVLFASSARTGSGPSRNTQNPNGVTANKATGDAKARAFLNGLRQQGVNVVGEQIYINTGLGDRIADGVIEVNGKYIAVEVKSGGGVRTALQFAKDLYINTFGGEAFGTAAQQSGINGAAISATRTFFIP